AASVRMVDAGSGSRNVGTIMFAVPLTRLRLQGSFRNFVQRIGYGAHQIAYALVPGRRDRVKFQAMLPAKFAERFKARSICRGIQLCSDYNHRLAGQRFTEGVQLARDHFERMNRVRIRRVASIDQMHQQAGALDVTKEAYSKTRALVRPLD